MRSLRFFALISLAFIPVMLFGRIVIYTPDNTTVFCNPERGFYHHTEQKVTNKGVTNLDESTFTSARSVGHTLLLRLYYFDNFRTKELSDAVLNQIDGDFGLFRKYGCKAVLRFAYDNNNDDGNQDGSPEIWKRHLEQLKPILHKNADVIAVVQAGFLGAWGEWYYSSQGTGAGIKQSIKNDLINELLDAVPESRCVQLRTPSYKRAYIGDTMALTAAEAFTGTPRARLGHHNDAFLYQSDNMGTYSNRTKDMNYLDRECLYVPNGGETDVYKESVYEAWATGDKARAEMAKLHYSYLNKDYCNVTLDHWRQDGTFNIVDAHMGYRLQLVETSIPSAVAKNAKLPIQIAICNKGYAPMYNERKVYIVLRSESNTYTFPLNTDPRRWLPNGVITHLSDSLSLPNDIVEDTYHVFLWLPDIAEAIQNDPHFAVRLANRDVWEEQTGYNSLLTTVTISQQGGTDDPDPEPQAHVEPVTNLQAVAQGNNAVLTWKNPDDPSPDTLVVDVAKGKGVVSSPENASSEITFSNQASQVTYSTSVDWAWAGVEFPVDDLENIETISFEYKGNGASHVLYPYAWDGDYKWRTSGFINLSSNEWKCFTFAPSIVLWGNEPSYPFGDQPVTQIGMVVNPAKAHSGVFQIRNVRVACEAKPSEDFVGLRIIRKENSAPSSFSDGLLVYYGKDSKFEDKSLAAGTTYYYAIYAFNADGEIAEPQICSVKIGGTDLNQTTSSSLGRTRKYIQNNRLYIYYNGHTYTSIGQAID